MKLFEVGVEILGARVQGALIGEVKAEGVKSDNKRLNGHKWKIKWFSSLSEENRKSNRLQMSWQRQHVLLSY